MIFAKEKAALLGQVKDLEGKLAAADGNVLALTGEKTKLEDRIKELETAQEGMVTNADHDTALKAQTDKIAELTGQLQAAEKNTDKTVREKIASAGVPAIERDPGAVDSTTKADAGGAGRAKQTWARDFSKAQF